jgi:hypothetical protein
MTPAFERLAARRAELIAGKSTAARIAIIPMTTRSSTSVKLESLDKREERGIFFMGRVGKDIGFTP